MSQPSNLDERYTVLVVDDTPDNLMLMSGLLKDLYKVKVAKNGERALQIAESETPPDLVLLDIMMPGMDGYEVCRRLKASPRTRDIPVIFLTAMSETEDEALGLSLGRGRLHHQADQPADRARACEDTSELKAARRFPARQERLSRAGSAAPHPRGRGDPGRHHHGDGLAGRNARQRNRQPHPPHAELREAAGREAADASALCRQAR